MTLFRLNLGLLFGSVAGDALSGEVAESDGSRIPDATQNGSEGTNNSTSRVAIHCLIIG